jgi:hypothetical protein
MKFTGTRSQLFQAIEDGGQRFQCIGQPGIPKMAAGGEAGFIATGASVAITRKLAQKRQDKRVRPLVKREVARAVKARQPKGLSFDFFG